MFDYYDERINEIDVFADAPDVVLSDRDIKGLGLDELFDYRKGPRFCGLDADIYWHDGEFDEEQWRFAVDEEIRRVKCYDRKLVNTIQGIIGYCFTNEFLLLQAFTRRSYAVENEFKASSEELEFFGDKVIDYVMIRTMAKQFTELDSYEKIPFISRFTEGELTKIKSSYVCKEYLSERAKVLGLDKYIYYGRSDMESDSAREDMMEALLGAVAIDCSWDYDVLEELVESLLDIHYDSPSRFLETDPYDRLNSWYQKRYGCIPDYKVDHMENGYYRCLLLIHGEVMEATAKSRSRAKSGAAEKAYEYLVREGLWCNLADSGVEPDYMKSVNQLQELFQKQYIDETEYVFSEEDGLWRCNCTSGLTKAYQYGRNKAEAKKRAAFKLLVELFKGSGMRRQEWDDINRKQMDEYYQWKDEMKKGTFSKGIKQTCNGCLGMRHGDSFDYCEKGKCPLGYRYDAERKAPLESCPRPKTYSRLRTVLEEKGIEWAAPEDLTIIPSKERE